MVKVYLKHQLNYLTLICFVIIIVYVMLQYAKVKNMDYSGISIDELYNKIGCRTYEEFSDFLDMRENELYAIRDFINYEGTGTEKTDDGRLMVNSTALKWYADELKRDTLFGNNRLSETVILNTIADDLNYQSLTEKRINENVRRFRRFSAKYGSVDSAKKKMYDRMADELGKAKVEFDKKNTYGIRECLKQFENIVPAIIISMLMSSFFFCDFFHGNLSKQMLASHLNVNKETFKTFLFAAFFSVICMVFLTVIMLFIWRDFIFEKNVLAIPIQALSGYSDITYSYTVGEYMVFLIIVQVLSIIMVNAVFQFVSWISKNVIISAVLSFVIGALMAYSYTNVIGELIKNNIFFIWNGMVIRKTHVALLFIMLIWFICAGIIAFFSKNRIRGIGMK